MDDRTAEVGGGHDGGMSPQTVASLAASRLSMTTMLPGELRRRTDAYALVACGIGSLRTLPAEVTVFNGLENTRVPRPTVPLADGCGASFCERLHNGALGTIAAYHLLKRQIEHSQPA